MRPWILVGALAIACDGTSEPPDDTSDTDPCPAGWQTSESPGLLASDFRVDTLRLQVAFDEALEHEGRPASCVKDDGTGADWLLALLGEPYGRIEAVASETGNQDLNGTPGALVIDLFGADPPVTFEVGDWQTGLYNVVSTDPFSITVSGTAVKEPARRLDIVVSAEASR